MSAQHAISGIRWMGAAFVAIHLCGCHVPSWDDLTSRELGVKALWTTPPPPMVVIEKSTDGYARAKAFNQLDEVSDPNERQERLKVLQVAAMRDRDPLCRIAALRTLGRYKDPQAGRILIDVYLSNPGLSPENNAFIRQQALTSLRYQSPAEARQLFIQAARQPSGSLTGTAQRDRMEILDERLTAIRALAKYPQPDAVDALVKLLETEKDTAIRKCAHESLVESTKKDIAPDAKAWREYVATGRAPEARGSTLLAGFQRPEPSRPKDEAPSSSTGTGLIGSFTNWLNQNPNDPSPAPLPKNLSQPAQPQPATVVPTVMQPTSAKTATIATPAVPVPSNSAPAAASPRSPAAIPAGSYRNSQGETVVPFNP